jgi:hypothetical protein
MFNEIGRRGFEAYVNAGNHEQFLAFAPVMADLTEKYDNVHDMTQTRAVENDGHTLVFLSGSEFGGGYLLGPKDPAFNEGNLSDPVESAFAKFLGDDNLDMSGVPTGNYLRSPDGNFIPFKTPKQMQLAANF